MSTVTVEELHIREQRAYDMGQRDGARAEMHGREADILDAERRAAVDALRAAADAWADLPEIGGRWTAAGIGEWLTIRADLIEEGGKF